MRRSRWQPQQMVQRQAVQPQQQQPRQQTPRAYSAPYMRNQQVQQGMGSMPAPRPPQQQNQQRQQAPQRPGGSWDFPSQFQPPSPPRPQTGPLPWGHPGGQQAPQPQPMDRTDPRLFPQQPGMYQEPPAQAVPRQPVPFPENPTMQRQLPTQPYQPPPQGPMPDFPQAPALGWGPGQGQTQVPQRWNDPTAVQWMQGQGGTPQAQGVQQSQRASQGNYPQGWPTGSPQGSWNGSGQNSSAMVSPTNSSNGGPQPQGADSVAPGQPMGAGGMGGQAPNQGVDAALASAGITPSGQPNQFDPAVLGLPNSPEFMGAEMALMDQLSKTLMELGVAREEIPARVQQFKSRMETDAGLQDLSINQSMADRGISPTSSPQSRALWEAAIPRQRQWHDYMTDVNSMYGQLSQQELGAHDIYRRGMQDLQYQQAQGLYDDPTSAVYSGNTDYYDPGGGEQGYFNAAQPGGYYDDYNQYTPPQQPAYVKPRSKPVRPHKPVPVKKKRNPKNKRKPKGRK